MSCQHCGEPIVDRRATAKFCSDRCRRRASDPAWTEESARRKGLTVLCNACGRRRAPRKSCAHCEKERHREAMEDLIERMWAEGKQARAIAKATGYSLKSTRKRISELRAAGRDLPYRRSDGGQNASRWQPGIGPKKKAA